MEPEDALSELDEFLWAVLKSQNAYLVDDEDLDDSESDAEEEDDDKYYDDDKVRILRDIRDLEASIAELRSRIQRGAFDSDSDALEEEMSSNIGDIGEFCIGPKALEEMEGDIQVVQAAARDLATEYNLMRCSSRIEATYQVVLNNTNTIARVAKELDEIEEFLKERIALTEEHRAAIAKGRQRLAWYRARRKLDEVELAEAAGNRAKADRLRKEAQVMLKQDWRRYLLSMPVPLLDDCPELT
jgi:hypothetical protein